jgi:hypothetical protein
MTVVVDHDCSFHFSPHPSFPIVSLSFPQHPSIPHPSRLELRNPFKLLRAKLPRGGVFPLDRAVKDVLNLHFALQLRNIAEGVTEVTPRYAVFLYNRARTAIMSATRAVLTAQGFVFDDPIVPFSAGQSKSIVYNVMDSQGLPWCAKVSSDNLVPEFATMNSLRFTGCVCLPTVHKLIPVYSGEVPPYAQTVSTLAELGYPDTMAWLIANYIVEPPQNQRAALIMPRYETTAQAFTGQQLPDSALMPIALGCLAGLDAMHQCGVIHCDIKPDNLCLTQQHPPRVVIIDLGGARAFGKQLRESSPLYCLDMANVAQPTLDLCCLASTVYHLSTGVLSPPTVAGLRAKLRESTSPLFRLALRCLEGHDAFAVLVEMLPECKRCVEFLSHRSRRRYEVLLATRVPSCADS